MEIGLMTNPSRSNAMYRRKRYLVMMRVSVSIASVKAAEERERARALDGEDDGGDQVEVCGRTMELAC
jgi:hypothetical protein